MAMRGMRGFLSDSITSLTYTHIEKVMKIASKPRIPRISLRADHSARRGALMPGNVGLNGCGGASRSTTRLITTGVNLLSAYIAQLNRALEADRLKQEERQQAKQQAEATAARERLTPLEDRLKRLLATIPIEVQREGLSLTALQTSLRGRWRGNAHPGEIGSALRKLGFVRKRQWHDALGFRALWVPDP